MLEFLDFPVGKDHLRGFDKYNNSKPPFQTYGIQISR